MKNGFSVQLLELKKKRTLGEFLNDLKEIWYVYTYMYLYGETLVADILK